MAKELWVEKWRPTKVDDYVFADQNMRNQIVEWIEHKAIPHLLFSGSAGLGKTTAAKMILHEMGVEKMDILELNASKDNKVELFREKVTNFVQTMPFGDFRYVILDEADYLSLNSQAVLRGLMEQYSNTARFILTCNYPHKIIPAIHSRSQSFKLEKLDRDDFKYRVATILVHENVECDEELIDTYIRASYPDLRKCINLLQQNTHNGILSSPSESSGHGQSDYWLKMVELFKNKQVREARKLICSQAQEEDFDNIYRFLYDNLEFWGDEDAQERAIIIIKNGLINHAIVADPEINLAATLVELADIAK